MMTDAVAANGRPNFPSLNDALAMVDAYAWHPLYEDATDSIAKSYDEYGPYEALARATELRDMFDVMCSPSPWGWLG